MQVQAAIDKPPKVLTPGTAAASPLDGASRSAATPSRNGAPGRPVAIPESPVAKSREFIDPRMKKMDPKDMPFDGMRMFMGGFEVMVKL